MNRVRLKNICNSFEIELTHFIRFITIFNLENIYYIKLYFNKYIYFINLNSCYIHLSRQT